MKGFQFQGYDKVMTMGRKSLDSCENPLLGGSAVSGGKNRCVISPTNAPFIADSLERRNQNWIAKANSPVDLIIEVGNSSFHLHKLAMVSRSGYLNRLVFQRGSNREKITSDTLKIQIKNLPGGAKTFELVVKFCYGWKIDITASNIAPLYCAAHFLEMSEDLEEENLISKTQPFLSFLILSSWKDTFQILKTTEPISSWAKELQIVKHCSEAIAWKACTSDTCWWFEDVSNLRVDHFIEVIQSIKNRGMKSELVGSCIADWTMKWFSQFALGLEKLAPKNIALQLHRASIECLIRILPTEENSVTCNFLLQLLKAGAMLRINLELLCVLEKRIASILEQCSVSDLLVKNQGDKGSFYDVGVVLRVLQRYVCHVTSNSAAKVHAVGKLVDGYLTQVARDENLTVESFKSLVEALPQNARSCDDQLYRSIDMFLKAHSYLTEEDRTDLCRVLEYHRLSREARQHVMKNDRLPLKLTTQCMLLEQVNMASSMMTSTSESNSRRASSHTFIRVSKDFERRQIINAHEVKMMKKDVEVMKSQILELNTCKVKLQKQMKRGFIW